MRVHDFILGTTSYPKDRIELRELLENAFDIDEDGVREAIGAV